MSWLKWILAYLFDCVHPHTTWPHRDRPMHPARKTPTSDAPDLTEQIRLSLAELESKKPGLPKNQVRKTPTPVKKKPQRVRA
jgi:hypothetical protein